jgi:ATP-binding cassette subfamily B (MDR/TAP) protein 1
MLERYERIISGQTPKIATYVNEMTDSIKTVAALGREREIMRGFGLQTHSTPKGSRFLVLGCIALGVGPGVTLLTGALMFYWFSQRLADGAVSSSQMSKPWETQNLTSAP